VICDLITEVLLFGQFNFLRSLALFVLPSGYLFTAFIAFAHALTFPGVFSPTGWLGAGARTTAWLSLEQLSLHDGLTSLANRRFFDTYLAGQVAIAHVKSVLCPSSCAMWMHSRPTTITMGTRPAMRA
jgi:GGDEF domain-containing protein